MSFTPSKYQQAVGDFIDTSTGSAVVQAVAGSGKTTTIVWAVEKIPTDKRVVFLAFNKKIADELKTRLPQHVKAATFHSVGYSAWRREHERCEVKGSKLRDLLDAHFTDLEIEAFGTVACKLVSVAKAVGVRILQPDDASTYLALASHFDIELPESDDGCARTIAAAQKLLALSIEAADAPMSVIDFDDMLYMPLLKEAPFYRYDVILVDEAQDTNDVQRAILKRMLRKGGRVIAVGDTHQAIYGFRGADANAMENLKRDFNAIELPLSISYRCAQSVVSLAQTIVPHIEASPTAPVGAVLTQSIHETAFLASDVIICRNTAPLIELAYDLIGRGTGCKVLGREIGQSLQSLVDKMKAKDIDTLLEKIEAYRAREAAKFVAKKQDEKAEAVNDKVACIVAIIGHLSEEARTMRGIKDAIERMFSDVPNVSILTLCTAHKSKGLEWKRVFIYRPELMPSKWARQEWQQVQERNLQYVAWTRAKETLVFLTEAAPQKRETMRERALRIDIEKGTPTNTFWDVSDIEPAE